MEVASSRPDHLPTLSVTMFSKFSLLTNTTFWLLMRLANNNYNVVLLPSGVMRINNPNNKRYFVVTEEVGDRCVVTCAATATWRNVVGMDVYLLAIGHCDRNALLLQMRIG